MIESHEFPTEFPADPPGADALRWTIGVLAPAALGLALLNAEAIASWTHELPASPRAATAMTVADAWQARTRALGLDAPRNAFQRTWKRAQAMRWPEGTDGRLLMAASAGDTRPMSPDPAAGRARPSPR